MRKKILVIIPDRFEKATGGMGANSAPVFEYLSKDYAFYVAAFPLAGGEKPAFVEEYKEVSSAFSEIHNGAVGTIAAQARYLSAALSFPKPDLIYAYDWSVYHAAVEAAEHFKVPLIARMCLSPILLGAQGYTFGLDVHHPVSKAVHDALCEMEIRGLKRADRIVHISKGYAKQYENIAPFQDKVRLVYNGIDFPKWQKECEPYPLPGTRSRKIIYIGRFAEMKGILPLCKAKVPDDMDLIFIGDSATADRVCMRAIEEKVKNEGNIHYIGPLYGEEKIRALRSADVLIVPSYHEPFGGVGLEGLAAGLMVLSSRAGGLGDYLTDDTSIFCGTTPEQIEQAYATFISLSSENKERMREKGYTFCKEHSVEASAQALAQVFEEVL